MKYKFFGFTLAEVLITLVIIGIIAARTVPIIYERNQDKYIKASLKKNYSVLSQVFEKYYIDNGIRFIPDELNYKQFKSMLLKYVINIKNCGYGYSGYDTTTIPCVAQSDFSNTYKSYNNKKGVHGGIFDEGQFVMSDGSTVFIQFTSATGYYVSVDVNGYKKKPNRLGKDLFMFQITKNGYLVPMGAPGTTYNNQENFCSNTSSEIYNGAACTYKVLQTDSTTI